MTPAQKKRLDILWRKQIITRDKRCQICGREATEAAHIIPRTYLQTRWLLKNGLGFCADCHREQHQYPTSATAWYQQKIGLDAWCDLKTMSTPRPDKGLYERMLKKLKGEVNGTMQMVPEF